MGLDKEDMRQVFAETGRWSMTTDYDSPLEQVLKLPWRLLDSIDLCLSTTVLNEATKMELQSIVCNLEKPQKTVLVAPIPNIKLSPSSSYTLAQHIVDVHNERVFRERETSTNQRSDH